MDKLKRFLIIVSPILLGFAVAYLLSSYLYYHFTDISVKLPEPKTMKINKKTNYANKKEIIDINIFNLELGEQLNSSNTLSTGAKSSKPFKGELVGILDGADKSFIIIRDGEKLLVLNKGKNSEGTEVIDITPKMATIRYNGNTITLKLVESNSAEKESKQTIKKNEVDEKSNGTIKKTVTRKEVEENLKDVNSLISTMYISPYYMGGEFVGYRVSRMRMDAFLRQAGIENGDVIVRMNGEDIETPDKMFDMFSKWKDATAVTIDLIRRAKKQTVFIEIK